MSQMQQQQQDARSRASTISKDGHVDYKSVDDLRRMLTPNGKILSRKRLGVPARAQREISAAIKRARFMALLPYTNATL